MSSRSETERAGAVNPRKVVEQRLRQDLGEVTEADITSGVLCGEMGCREMKEFILNHPVLRCPYGRFPDGEDRCARLREEYRAAIGRDDVQPRRP